MRWSRCCNRRMLSGARGGAGARTSAGRWRARRARRRGAGGRGRQRVAPLDAARRRVLTQERGLSRDLQLNRRRVQLAFPLDQQVAQLAHLGRRHAHVCWLRGCCCCVGLRGNKCQRLQSHSVIPETISSSTQSAATCAAAAVGAAAIDGRSVLQRQTPRGERRSLREREERKRDS